MAMQSAVVDVEALAAQLAAITAAGGALVTAFALPFPTDGNGNQVVVIWTQ